MTHKLWVCRACVRAYAEVRLGEYGSDFIEVVDNGSGIDPSNFVALSM